MHLEAPIEQVWWYIKKAVVVQVWRWTWRSWSSQLEDALGGRDQANVWMHLVAEIKRVRRYTWRLWSSEFGPMLQDSWLTVHRVLRLYSTDSKHPTVGIWLGDFTFEVSWWAGQCWSSVMGGMPEAEGMLKGQLVIIRRKRRQIMFGVYCNRWMLYSVSTHDRDMDRYR